jgi:serine/threonine protein kinase
VKLIYEGANETKIYRDGWIVYKETEKAEKEFNILSGLKHPNIIKVYEFFGNSYSMEYFEGIYMTAPCDGKLAM